jgi:hypothetical protein
MNTVDHQVSPSETSSSTASPLVPDTARHDAETAVAEICARVLGVERVDLQDNFLLLGGESLLATQVASLIRDKFNREVSIRSILVGTIAELAAEVCPS